MNQNLANQSFENRRAKNARVSTPRSWRLCRHESDEWYVINIKYFLREYLDDERYVIKNDIPGGAHRMSVVNNTRAVYSDL